MGVSSSKPHSVETKYFHEFEKTSIPSLQGKTIVITGCTTGTGFITAKTCAKKGAKNILMLNRLSDRSKSAETEVKKFIPDDNNETSVETIECDLQDFENVKKACSYIKEKYDAIDVLCNNAGVMALEDIATKDGYDVQMQTNHLSHFLIVKELYPLLKKAKEINGEARIVHHSSLARNGGALKPEYFEKRGGNLGGNGNSMLMKGARWERYHQTKLANAVFTKTLTSRLDGTGIKAVVAAPGLAATNLQVTTNQRGGMGSSMWIMRMSQSAEDGSMPLLAACFEKSAENGDFWEPANRGGMSGPAVKVKWDKLSSNEDFQKMLWAKSEEACGEFKCE